MDIKNLVMKLIKGFFIAWIIFIIIGIIIMGLSNKGVFSKLKSKVDSIAYSKYVKAIDVKAGGTPLEVLSNNSIKANLYEIPANVNIWSVNGDKVLYSTIIEKEEVYGAAYDLNFYNMETGENTIIRKMDSKSLINDASFNDKYVLWIEDNKSKVLDIYSNEIIYEGPKTFNATLSKDILLSYYDSILTVVNLRDKSKEEISLNIDEVSISYTSLLDNFIAFKGDGILYVYNREDKTLYKQEEIEGNPLINILTKDNKIIFLGMDTKDSIEFNIDTKSFDKYKVSDDIQNTISYNIEEGSYALRRKDNLEVLSIIDITTNEVIDIDISTIEDKSFSIAAYEDNLLLSLVGGGPADIWRKSIKLERE